MTEKDGSCLNRSLPLRFLHMVLHTCKVLIREKHRIELSDQQALEQCANLVKYVFLTEYALPPLKRLEEGD
jgi:hypothetical protein